MYLIHTYLSILLFDLPHLVTFSKRLSEANVTLFQNVVLGSERPRIPKPCYISVKIQSTIDFCDRFL